MGEKKIKDNSIKIKLLIIFMIPSFAFLYLSYLYVQNEFSVQDKISRYKYSIELITDTSELVHNLQIERGLSAGYIISNNEDIKIKMLKQYKITNKSYKKLVQMSNKDSFTGNISIKEQNSIFKIIEVLKKIDDYRKSVLNSSVSFDNEINYYSDINDKLILTIKNINSNFIDLHNDYNTIYYFLKIQEYAGLERAYTYNFLLSNEKKNIILWSIQEFVKQKRILTENLLLSTSLNSNSIYNKLYKKKIEEKVHNCFQSILKDDSLQIDAEECFNASTKYIDMIDTIYHKILNNYVNKVNKLYNDSLTDLYLILALEVISAFIMLFLFYILFKLIDKEEKNKVDLRISAYTFEAQEGVVITDAEGIILKVNKSFTSITGYTLDEALDNTPRILKSDQHSEKFYKNIWDKLTQDGQWKGEIINKRKNGEFYNEMLSISSIKDENGITTHYIAQFLDISEIRKVQKELQYQVDHDSLSGLLNRRALKQRLNEESSKARRHNLLYAFLFIDLDNFKSINDTYGHDIGDKVIIEVAKRLKSILREEDIIARLSGDEFAILFANYEKDRKIIEKISTKILNEISKEMIFGEYNIQISSSIGIKLFFDDDISIENIIAHADNAMYRAKKKGKNQFIFYDD